MLTPKEEKYCQIRAFETKTSNVDAYLLAGYSDSKSVDVRAGELASKLHIRKRILDLRDMAAIEGLWSREYSINVLKEIALRSKFKRCPETDEIIPPAKDVDKINAVKELNVMNGFNAPIKHEVQTTNHTPLTLEDLYNESFAQFDKE